MRPRILLSFNELTKEWTTESPHPKKHIVPYLINVKFFDTFDRYLGFDEPYIVYPCHIFYNTRERVEPTPSINMNRLMETYHDFEGTREDLKSALVEIEHLSKADAKHKSNFIFLARDNPHLWKLFLSKQKTKK
jgi:hypothetical protein